MTILALILQMLGVAQEVIPEIMQAVHVARQPQAVTTAKQHVATATGSK